MKKEQTDTFLRVTTSKKIGWMVSLALGVGIGVTFHFLLYRVALPVEPFIYVAF